MTRDPVLARVARARPVDRVGRGDDATAVRVLARVAVLEHRHGRAVARPRARVAVAAALVAAVVVTLAPDTRRTLSPEAGPRARDAAPWGLRRSVEAALAGDPAARRRVVESGVAGREALLDVAARHGPGALAALRLLEAAGGVRDRLEAEAVPIRPSDHSERTRAALRVLSHALSDAGPERLGRLLAEHPVLEEAAVEALRSVARGGRQRLATQALLCGVRAGRTLAAAEVLALRGAGGVDEVLRTLPAPLLEDEAIVRAIRQGGATPALRLLRLAERGDRRARRLAAAARVDGIVTVLLAGALGADSEDAREAVALLERVGSRESALALARALDGAAWTSAGAALGRLDPGVVRSLREDVRPRDRAAARLALSYVDGSASDATARPKGSPEERTRGVETASVDRVRRRGSI